MDTVEKWRRTRPLQTSHRGIKIPHGDYIDTQRNRRRDVHNSSLVGFGFCLVVLVCCLAIWS